MAKLYLKYEQAVLKEFPLSQGVVTIGRLPDNLIQVDNLAVSSHHAKIYWETDHFVLEDNNSLNGTYVNKRRVSKAVLKDGDEILIGKHTIAFQDAWHDDKPQEKTVAQAVAAVPTLEATMVLDTKKAKAMLEATAAAAVGGNAAPSSATAPISPGVIPQQAPKDQTGVLTIMAGKTEQNRYVLSSKLTVIGKSDMASIKLKGWFAPKVAAVINRRDNKYFIAASEKDIKVKINEAEIAGQKELSEGDMVEVAGVKATFGYE